MAEGRVRETSIALTPVAEGRFEIYLDGAKVYDRKDPNEDNFVPKLKVIRKIEYELKDLMEVAEKVAPYRRIPQSLSYREPRTRVLAIRQDPCAWLNPAA